MGSVSARSDPEQEHTGGRGGRGGGRSLSLGATLPRRLQPLRRALARARTTSFENHFRTAPFFAPRDRERDGGYATMWLTCVRRIAEEDRPQRSIIAPIGARETSPVPYAAQETLRQSPPYHVAPCVVSLALFFFFSFISRSFPSFFSLSPLFLRYHFPSPFLSRARSRTRFFHLPPLFPPPPSVSSSLASVRRLARSRRVFSRGRMREKGESAGDWYRERDTPLRRERNRSSCEFVFLFIADGLQRRCNCTLRCCAALRCCATGSCEWTPIGRTICCWRRSRKVRLILPSRRSRKWKVFDRKKCRGVFSS